MKSPNDREVVKEMTRSLNQNLSSDGSYSLAQLLSPPMPLDRELCLYTHHHGSRVENLVVAIVAWGRC